MHIQEAGKGIDIGRLAPCSKLFVVGCPRSGASWVTTLIAKHPNIVAVPRDTHVYQLVYEPFVELPRWNLQQRLRAWKHILRRYGIKPLLVGFEPADIWQGILRDYNHLNRPNSHGLHGLVSYGELQSLIKAIRAQVSATNRGLHQAEELIAAMFERFLEQRGKPGQIMLEKTPMHIRYAEQILWRFPEARIIEVVRDGRDVCVSHNTLDSEQLWSRHSTSRAIRQWKQCVEWGELIRERIGLRLRVHTVRYEALKADTERYLQQIFDFANLDWNEQQVKQIITTVEKNNGSYIRPGSVGDWKKHLSVAEVKMCDEIAGEQLVRLGYIANR